MKQLIEQICPDRKHHTEQPDSLDHDYLAWHAWALKMSKTHEQIKCKGCGLWAIWVPKSAVTRPNQREGT